MDTRAIFKASGFLILTVISIPSNLFICCAFLHTRLTEAKLTPADVVLCHLAIANVTSAFTRSFPQMLTAFGCRNLFDDFGCKLVVFFYRVSRSLSINLTCLLSTYQAVLVSPATSKLAPFKARIPQYLWHLMASFYILYSAININAALNSFASFPNNTIPPYTYNLQFCFVSYPDQIGFVSGGLANFFTDLLFIVSMTAMSGYILLLLYKHSKKVRSLRSSESGQSGARAEVKASRAVVTLVSLYTVFFGVDNFIWLYSLTVVRVAPLLSDVRVFFATIYTSVCPVVVIFTNPRVNSKLKFSKPEPLASQTENSKSNV
uniref:Vomeronasal type-1 receptor n=1 Tax=Erpetoichthys calabaricus TaxID=27687 RepID=A0A8C4SWZ8_ERPCA